MAIYLHEIITIDRGGKEAYLEGLRAQWAPHAERTRGMKLVWIGSTIGSTASWPETMALWELRDFEHYAQVVSRMYTESTPDAELLRWWQEMAKHRKQSRSQTLIGAPFSPTLDELRARGVSGTAYAFATYRVAAGRGEEMLTALAQRAAIDARLGRALVGAYEVAFTNDRAYAIWCHAGLDELTRYAATSSTVGEIRRWCDSVDGLLLESSECWGYATPYCPLWPASYKTETKIW